MSFEKQLIAKYLDGNLSSQFIGENIDELQKDPNKYRPYCLNNPETAYWFALYVDKSSGDETRKACSRDPFIAYDYASHLDKTPLPETRKGACTNPWVAFCYAKNIDKGPHEDTWKAVQGSEYQDKYYNFIGVPK